jgi:hypothetical protein
MTGGMALPSAREGRHKNLLRNCPSAKQSRTDGARPKPTVNMTSLSSKRYTNSVTTAWSFCSQGCQRPVTASCNTASCTVTDTYQAFGRIVAVYSGRYPLYARTEIGLYVLCVSFCVPSCILWRVCTFDFPTSCPIFKEISMIFVSLQATTPSYISALKSVLGTQWTPEFATLAVGSWKFV